MTICSGLPYVPKQDAGTFGNSLIRRNITVFSVRVLFRIPFSFEIADEAKIFELFEKDLN